MTAVDNALAEITEKLDSLSPQLEGLRDYQRLNLHEDTRREVEFSIQQYERRLSHLLASHQALESLVNDGHPDLDTREVAQAVYNDLKDNKDTIDAALAQFSPNVASTLHPTSGDVEPK